MSAYNQIRKYRIAIGKPINMNNIICKPDIGKQVNSESGNMHKINGVVDAMLHPIGLRIEKLLSEGSKSLISMILTKKPLRKTVFTDSNGC
jgi:hypothetical protein